MTSLASTSHPLQRRDREHPDRPASPSTVETPDAGHPRQWLAEHGDALFAYALVRLRRQDLAEDLVQETFLAALKSREGFDGRSTLRTWLIGILRHKIADHFRRSPRSASDVLSDSNQQRRESAEETAIDGLFNRRGLWASKPKSWGSAPEAASEHDDLRLALHRCLAKLSETLAEAITLREISGLSCRQIGDVLNVSEESVWTRLHRGRTLLRECLERTWLDSERTP